MECCSKYILNGRHSPIFSSAVRKLAKLLSIWGGLGLITTIGIGRCWESVSVFCALINSAQGHDALVGMPDRS